MAKDLYELPTDVCLALLEEHRVGRLAINDSRGPLVVPINYRLDRGMIVFRSDIGSKLAAAEWGKSGSLQIDHVDEINRVGWSVLVRGRLREVVGASELEEVAAIADDPFSTGDGKAHHVVLQPSMMTGRVSRLPDALPEGWVGSAVLGTDIILRAMPYVHDGHLAPEPTSGDA